MYITSFKHINMSTSTDSTGKTGKKRLTIGIYYHSYNYSIFITSAGAVCTYLSNSAHYNVSVHFSLVISVIIYQEVLPNTRAVSQSALFSLLVHLWTCEKSLVTAQVLFRFTFSQVQIKYPEVFLFRPFSQRCIGN